MNGTLCPIEGKSSNYKCHESFDIFMKNERFIIYT